MFPQEEEIFLIQSTTSTNLQKLVFAPYCPMMNLEDLLDHPCWVPFNDMMCRLVDRPRAPGYRNTLEVEFRLLFWYPAGKARHRGFLQKFKGKGRVTVTKLPLP